MNPFILPFSGFIDAFLIVHYRLSSSSFAAIAYGLNIWMDQNKEHQNVLHALLASQAGRGGHFITPATGNQSCKLITSHPPPYSGPIGPLRPPRGCIRRRSAA